MTDARPPVPPPAGTVDVPDVRALKALAHPLRGRLLAALRTGGPSTASRLAQQLGESSGLTSYHLRQLAAAGFVEELPDEGNARDRWWRAPHRGTRIDTAALAGQPGGREVVEELDHLLLTQHQRMLARHAAERDDLDDDQRLAVSLNDWGLRLSPAGVRELADELNAVLARWRDEREEPGRPVVSVLVDLFPLQEYPL